MNTLFYRLILISIASLTFGCASIQAPSGGPKDTTPPKIDKVYPIDKTINFKDNVLRINFSKYMNKNSVIDNVNIFPETKAKYNWSGKELEIEFLEELKENTTYSVTLSPEMTDYISNKAEQAYTFTFSNGPNLDSGIVAGIYLGAKVENLYAFAFVVSDSSDNLISKVPDYKLKIGSSGEFEFKGLKNDNYRVIVVQDAFTDGKYDIGSDGYSASAFDINSYDIETKKLRFKYLKYIDTTAPKLEDVKIVNKHLLSLKFSELVSNKVEMQNNPMIMIKDSLQNKIEIYNKTFEYPSGNTINLFTIDSLLENMKYEVTTYQISDSVGNYSKLDTIFVQAKSIESMNVEKNVIEFVNVKDSLKNFNTADTILFRYKYPIDIENIKNNIQIEKKVSKEILEHKIEEKYVGVYSLIIEKPLENNLPYLLSAKPFKNNKWNKFDAVDSSFIYFTTADKKMMSSVSGRINSKDTCMGNYVLTGIVDSKKYLAKVDGDKFVFNDLPAGTMKFDCFCDINFNGIFDVGKISPYQYSEIIYIIGKEITIKARWDMEDLILELQ